jgi:xanthine dehydrogenase accessory factor
LLCLVRGIGDVGSAVAHALFQAGHRVAIHDVPAPTAHRRRMAFVDAIFDGSAVLDGVPARRVDNAGELVPIMQRGEFIPVSIAPFDTVLHVAAWDVLIDARMRKRAVPESQRGLAHLTIGLGPGFVAGDNTDMVIETGWDNLGTVIHRGPTAALRGEPSEIRGHRRDRLVYAPEAGVFVTNRSIGELVVAGETIASIGDRKLAAPVAGAIRGLTRSGVPVDVRTKVIEIDPRGSEAVVSGLGERPRRIATGVLQAIGEFSSRRVGRTQLGVA